MSGELEADNDANERLQEVEERLATLEAQGEIEEPATVSTPTAEPAFQLAYQGVSTNDGEALPVENVETTVKEVLDVSLP